MSDEEDDDFSLDGGTESEADEAFSDEEQEDEDEDDDVAESEASESDFESAAPAKKKAKATPKPAAKAAAPAAKKKESSAAASKAPKKAPAKSAPAAAVAGSSVAKKPSAPSKPAFGAGAKAPVAATPIKAADAPGVVLDYMRKMNRPYSLLNVFENLHKTIAKPTLTKLLDDLVDKGELTSKLYGKAKIYAMNQLKLPVPSEDERQQIEDQIRTTDADCAALEQELKTLESTLSGINSQISDADLETTVQQLEEEAKALKAKIATLERPDLTPISPGRKDALKRKFATYRTAWVTRKRIAVDAVNQIADGMEKKPKAVYDLCGIETDADVGVKEIPTI